MGSLNDEQVHRTTSPFTLNPLDPEEFRRQGHMIIDFLADYYQHIEKYPVRSQVEPGYLGRILPDSAPYNPELIETILQDVQRHIIPGLTHWQSPNYFAYFPSSGSIAGFLGEMLSTGFNVIGFSWMASPAATELESIVMDWQWWGCITRDYLTTCEAILCTLSAARDKLLGEIGREHLSKLVVYGSDQTHCALQKASQIAGIHPNNFRACKTVKSDAFALSPDLLRSVIQSDVDAGLVPLYLCATVGTTSTTAVDPLKPLCHVAKEYGIWVHVDAAYGGSACICPEFRHYIDGVECANSFSLNAHKWFFTTLDCCCLWVKEPNALVKALSTNLEYLSNKATYSKQVVDYKDWQIPLSRRFRALKLWLVLRSYGALNLRSFIRCHVEMANHFEGLVSMDERFEIVVPRNFAMVCFRLSPSAMLKNVHKNNYRAAIDHDHQKLSNDVNRKLLESINESGRFFMTHAIVGGVYVIRFAVGATLTEYRHINMAWDVVQEHVRAILSSS